MRPPLQQPGISIRNLNPLFNMSQPIHFVHETKPGTALDSSQVRALRSHVRKVNLERSNQKSSRRLENFRSLTVNDFSEGGKLKNGKRKQSPKADATQNLETEIENLPSGAGVAHGFPQGSSSPETSTRAFQFLSSPSPERLPRRCSCPRENLPNQRFRSSQLYSSPDASPSSTHKHPYASKISEVVDLDEARIDTLLNSCKFFDHARWRILS
jgi:hypothetical protein